MLCGESGGVESAAEDDAWLVLAFTTTSHRRRSWPTSDSVRHWRRLTDSELCVEPSENSQQLSCLTVCCTNWLLDLLKENASYSEFPRRYCEAM